MASSIVGRRYRILHRLGGGVSGTTYLAEDRERHGAKVVLKVCPPEEATPAVLATLANEFNIRRRLNHPWIARVYDFGRLRGRGAFLTAEYVDGVGFREGTQDLQPGEIARLGEQLLRALAYLHAQGILHGDLKAEHVLVCREPEGRTIRLLDFGLARAQGSRRRAGSVETVAPEVLRGDPCDARSDLFSAGVLLYEAIAGKLPWGRAGLATRLRLLEEGRIPPASTHRAGVPAALDAILSRLIAARPEDRYPSAEEALLDLVILTGGKGAAGAGLRTSSTPLFAPGGFVGRSAELADLRAQLTFVSTREPGAAGRQRVVWISGEAGAGKTRFVEEFRAQVQLQGIVFLEGSEAVARLRRRSPFAASRAATVVFLDDLIAEDPRLVDLAKKCSSRADPGESLLVLAASRCGPPPGSDRVLAAGQESAPRRAGSGVCVDLHVPLPGLSEEALLDWAQRSASLARDLLGRRGIQAVHALSQGLPAWVLHVGAVAEQGLHRYRLPVEQCLSVEGLAASLHALDGNERFQDVPSALTGPHRRVLAALALASPWGLTRHQLGAVVGRPVPAVSEALTALGAGGVLAPADGKVLRLRHVGIAASCRRALLPGERERLDVRLGRLPGIPPGRAAHFLLRAGADEEALPHLVEATRRFARSGEPHLALETGLQALAGSRHAGGQERACLLERLGMVSLAVGDGDKAAVFFRQALAPELRCDPESRARRLVGLCEAQVGPGGRGAILETARQARAALRRVPAASRGVLAARLHHAEGAAALAGAEVQKAIRSCRAALRLLREGSRRGGASRAIELESSCRSTLAEALRAKGDAEGSLAVHREVISLARRARDRRVQANALTKAGNVLRTMGRLGEAEKAYRQGLRLREGSVDLRGIAASCLSLGVLAKVRGQYGRALDFYKRSLVFAERVSPAREVASVLNNLGNLYSAQGRYAFARDYFTRCRKLLRGLQEWERLGFVQTNLGLAYLWMGRLGEAAEVLREGLAWNRTADHPGPAILGLLSLGWTEMERGRLREVHRALDEAHEIGGARIPPQSLGFLAEVRGLARLEEDAVAPAREAFVTAGKRFVEAGLEEEAARATLREAECDLLLGHIPAARSRLKEAGRRARTLPAPILQAQYHLLRADIAITSGERDAVASVGKVEPLLRVESLAEERVFLARAWARLGGLHRRVGDVAAAFAAMGRGVSFLEDLVAAAGPPAQARGLLRVRWVRQLGAEIAALAAGQRDAAGGGRRAVSLERLKADLFDAGRKLPARSGESEKRIEGLQRILEVGHAMNATHELEPLLGFIVDRVLEITHGERGILLLRGAGGEFIVGCARSRAGEDIPNAELEVSRTLVEQVLREGKTAVVRDALEEEGLGHRPSILKFELRSALCAPLRYRGEPLGVLYVDHRSQVGRFGEDDVKLLDLFAHQAALAISNSRLVQELRASLETQRAAYEESLRGARLRALGEMSGIVAHDFRNVLTIILGRTQLLAESVSDVETRQDLGVLERAARDGMAIIERMLASAKDASEEPGIVRQRVELAALVEECLQAVSVRDGGNGNRKAKIRIERVLGEIPPLELDEVRVRECLTNVFVNAMDAMPQGGLLRVETRCVPEGVELVVSDTGEGMSPEVLAHAFDLFYTTKGKAGTGLGLASVRSILHKHGGEVRVESEAGRGTRVILLFPRPEKADPGAGSEAPRECPAPVGSRRERRARVLVVDDEKMVGDVVADLLRREGHDVSAVTAAEEALRMLREEPFDLVVTDLGMPAVNGFELASRAKRLRPGIPVILLTGWGEDQLVDRLRRSGIEAHVTKATDLGEVARVVGEALAKRARQTSDLD